MNKLTRDKERVIVIDLRKMDDDQLTALWIATSRGGNKERTDELACWANGVLTLRIKERAAERPLCVCRSDDPAWAKSVDKETAKQVGRKIGKGLRLMRRR